MTLPERADMYTALAEALAEPPQWMCLPGREWPLFDLAMQLLPNSAALSSMALIQEELLTARMGRYTSLSSGQAGQPHFWLYESAFLTGRILGQSTFDVAKSYSQAGLEVDGSELPDGAAPELAFLAFLACSDPVAEKDFLKNHAARWLPALGQALARGSDPVYAAIGQLLSDWITNAGSPPPTMDQSRIRIVPAGASRLPILTNAPACTLCGFCVQRCPTQALVIHERLDQTTLELLGSRCSGCGRCAAICDARLLVMQPAKGTSPSQPQVLRVSERVVCKSCGEPMVSRAEMDYVIRQIGHPAWLDYCPSCRLRVG